MNLIEGIQEKCNYIRDTIIPEYEAIGPAGSLGRVLLRLKIKEAEAVIASGDTIAMLRTLKALESTCERAL